MKSTHSKKIFKKFNFKFFSFLTILLFFSCKSDENIINGNLPIDNINNAQPIDPEGKEIAFLGESEGEVSLNLKNGKMNLNSLQIGSQSNDVFSKANNKIGTLVISVTKNDLLNLDRLEKIYKEALDKDITVYFESTIVNRKALNEVYETLLGGVKNNNQNIYAVKIQKYTDGSYGMTPYGEKINLGFKRNLRSSYGIIEEENINNKTLNSINVLEKGSIKSAALVNKGDHYYSVNGNITKIASDLEDQLIGGYSLSQEITFEGIKQGGYMVYEKGPKKVEVIATGSLMRQDYNKNIARDAQASLNITTSDTKTWSVGLSPGTKSKGVKEALTEIAISPSASYGGSTTKGVNDQGAYQCLYERNWVEYVINTVKAKDAKFKGYATFYIKWEYQDFNDSYESKTVKVVIHYAGTGSTPESFSGVKPISQTEFVYRYSGKALRRK